MTIQWLTNPNVKPPTPSMLGELPRGFMRSGSGPGLECDDASPAYVRGILLPTTTYKKLSFDQRLQLGQPNVFPRWRLYGGPFSMRYVAQQWEEYLHFWGFNNGQTFVSHQVVCIVPNHILKWPTDTNVRWDWVYETTYATVASRKWENGKYVLTFSNSIS